MFVMNYADVTKILSQHEKKHISAKKEPVSIKKSVYSLKIISKTLSSAIKSINSLDMSVIFFS